MSNAIRRLEARVEELERELSQLKTEIEELKQSSVMMLKPPKSEYTTAAKAEKR